MFVLWLNKGWVREVIVVVRNLLGLIIMVFVELVYFVLLFSVIEG